MNYSLIVSPATSARPDAFEVKSIGQNPAMMQRRNVVDFDQGREWAGDYYTEGPVTDPQEAYAHFQGGEDTEAWLDKGDDNTLIGWVRVGNDIWRYSDPEAWALDVDGAGMSRTDAGAGMSTGEPTATPEQPGVEDTANLGVDPGAAGGDPAAADPAANESGIPGEDLPDAPTGFDNEADPATTEVDPTEPLEDPTRLDEESSDAATNPFDGLTDEDVELDETGVPGQSEPAEDVAPEAEEPGEDPSEEATETPVEEQAEETVEPEEPEQPDGDEPPGTPEEPETPAEEDEEELKKRLALQGKHLPGQHNQEEHGNWAHHHLPGHILPRARRSSGTSTPGAGGAPAAPKAGEAAPAKARLSPDSVRAMSTEDLAALMESPDLYDMDTMLAAAEAYDERNDEHDRITTGAKHLEPGSADEAALFDSIIPPAWTWWAGRGAKGKRPGGGTRRDDIEDQWLHYWYNLILRAEADPNVNGVFMRKGVTTEMLAKKNLKVEDFFNARVARQKLRNLMSPELIDWLDKHAISRREWLAEFYPSYAKQLRELGSGEALGENG